MNNQSPQRRQNQDPFLRLPRIHIKSFFGKFRSNDGSPRELTSSKRLDSFLCRLNVLVLDVNLANTKVDTCTGGARNLRLHDRAVLAALLFDVFLDFYDQLVLCTEKNAQ